MGFLDTLTYTSVGKEIFGGLKLNENSKEMTY
jgi:hypothetical protein